MSSLKVMGHVNPDTDSTCSPIVYAWYLSNFKGLEAKAYLAGEPNKEALYVLNKFGIEKPTIISQLSEGDKIVLIDTNNADELLPGFEKSEIVEIVDHHKLFGNLITSSPIKITMEPVACVATIIWEKIKSENQSTMPIEMAGLLLSAILSDTLKFTSPTTTAKDKTAANELAEIALVDINELSSAMFEAKSDLSGMTADDILHVDSKVFEFGDKKLRISVLETTKPANALSMIEDIKLRMNELKREGIDGVMLYVVDILNTSSEVIVPSEFERDIVSKAHNVEFTGQTVTLPGVVSRKKQIAPYIEKVLS